MVRQKVTELQKKLRSKLRL
ncbi:MULTISPECIES: hypothetical protein [unclassified Bacillus (in: firmicutes)]